MITAEQARKRVRKNYKARVRAAFEAPPAEAGGASILIYWGDDK